MDQVADFLGHDIRVHREYYRFPEATTQLAKISKLLIAMEKGSLANLQGKTLEEMEIEDNLELSDVEQNEESEVEEENPPTHPETDNDCSGMRTVEQQPEKLPDPSLLSLEGSADKRRAIL